MPSLRSFSRLSAAVLVALTFTPQLSLAQELPEMAAIEQAWQRGDFTSVRQGLQQLAEQTDSALAHYRYGRVLLEGRGGPVDVSGAVEWLQRAVNGNHAQAAALLARIYLSGMPNGPARDPERAAVLLNKAATRGNAEAQYYLGLLYKKGAGVPQDLTQAFDWLLASAEQGYVESQYELANAYAEGFGTPKNTPEALRWLSSAADSGHANAQFFLAMAMDSGQGAPLDRKAALGWLRRAAESGHVMAQRILGKKYLQGDGTEANAVEALRWLQSAAKADDGIAYYLMGTAFRGDYTIPADPKRAWEMFNASSQYSYGPATTAMGRMLETGQAGAVKLADAVALYRRALQQGDQSAALQLGRMAGAGTLEGLAPPHRAVPWAMAAAANGDEAALEWVQRQAESGIRPAQTAYGIWLVEQGRATQASEFLLLAAQRGGVDAQYQLGLMRTTGDGIEQDYVRAHSWMNIAATGGHAEAAEKRDVLNDLLTPEQVAEAQALTRAYFEAARKADPTANLKAGRE